jgi:hypothetical protein
MLESCGDQSCVVQWRSSAECLLDGETVNEFESKWWHERRVLKGAFNLVPPIDSIKGCGTMVPFIDGARTRTKTPHKTMFGG